MTFRVFRHAVSQVRRPLAALTVGAAAFFYIAVLSSSTFAPQMSQVPLFANPPRAIRALLGSSDFLSPHGWVAIGLGHPVTMSIFAAAALMVASSAVATEVERGTIEFVVSRPIHRRQFLMGKLLAALLPVTIVQAGAFLGLSLARATIEGAGVIELTSVARGFLGSWFLFSSFAMVASFASATSSLRGRAIGMAIGALVASFFLNSAALLVDALYPLRFLSLFHYVRPDDLIAGRAMAPLLVPMGVGIAAGAAALVSFARRDITR